MDKQMWIDSQIELSANKDISCKDHSVITHKYKFDLFIIGVTLLFQMNVYSSKMKPSREISA